MADIRESQQSLMLALQTFSCALGVEFIPDNEQEGGEKTVLKDRLFLIKHFLNLQQEFE